jgi:hypothetical protein
MAAERRLTAGGRILVLILAGSVILGGAGVTLAAAAVYHAGSVLVDVRDGGGGFSLRVPAVAVDLALGFVPPRVVETALNEAELAVESWLPALRAAVHELAAAPDFVLLEISSPGSRVRIEKRGRSLLVHVDSDDDGVRVELPLHTARSFADWLARS